MAAPSGPHAHSLLPPGSQNHCSPLAADPLGEAAQAETPPLCVSLTATCATSQTFSMNTDATTSRMGVWPPGAGLQGQAPNHPMLLCSKDRVVSDGEKADVIRQVSDEKMSASESLLTHRKGFQSLSKRVEVADTLISVDVTCLGSTRQPVFRRHEPITGLGSRNRTLAGSANQVRC
jgi:hypothetical protein